jgi:hypothetical protein
MEYESNRRKPQKVGLIARIFPWPFLLVGLVVLGWGLRNLTKAAQSDDWPTAEGQIVSSEVRTSRNSSSGKNGSSGPSYRADISYRYSVNGASYTGDRVAYGDYGSGNPSHAREIVDRYPAGRDVKVYHDPEKPAECVLEPGTKPQAFILPTVGAVFALVGFGMLIGLPMAARKAERQRRTRGVPDVR